MLPENTSSYKSFFKLEILNGDWAKRLFLAEKLLRLYATSWKGRSEVANELTHIKAVL